jgi:hypothetical protein
MPVGNYAFGQDCRPGKFEYYVARIYASGRNTMSVADLEVDHVYVWVTRGGPELPALQELGLKAHGHVTVHTGQGSASQSFLFRTMYLELVWVEDERELAEFIAATPNASGPPPPGDTSGISPFGIGLHYRTPDSPPLPIELEPYVASWMPEGSVIDIPPRISPYSPSVFVLRGPLAYLDVPAHLTGQPLGLERLTGLAVTVPDGAPLDPAMEYLVERGVAALRRGARPLMELTFDGGRQGKALELGPSFPLIIRY